MSGVLSAGTEQALKGWISGDLYGHPRAVIGLVGYARSGKDTLAGFLVRDLGFTRRAFADLLKDTALAIDPYVRTDVTHAPRLLSDVVGHQGWERAKAHEDVRRFLQNLGVACRSLDPDIWVRPVLRDLPDFTVITDVRFPNEADAVRSLGGQLWRVTRPGTGPALGHISDTALEDYPVDRTIINDGSVEDLRRRIYDHA